MDLSKARVDIAKGTPNSEAWTLEQCDSVKRIQELTNNVGLDGVLICAATESNSPVNLSFDLCRKSGCVSVVGDVGLNLERKKMYAKEIDVRMSCSYGPGRYDSNYELRGQEYQLSHIRWSEGRNLEHFRLIWMLKAGTLDLKELITGRFMIDEAPEAYKEIKGNNPETLGVLLDYGIPPTVEKASQEALHGVRINTGFPSSNALFHQTDDGPLRLGIIGAGGYVKNMHLPNLKKLENKFCVRAIISRTGGSASVCGRRFKVPIVGSDHRIILDDPDIDAVLIATRHANHAQFVLDALDAGKHVFVEKPMTTNIKDAQRIVEAADRTGLIVRVGFNRRFAPFIQAMKKFVGRTGVKILYSRINIGRLNNDWSNTDEEGGRLLGEAVHFYDLANWFMDAEPLSMTSGMAGTAESKNPNASVLLNYPDGSLANILYTSLGNKNMGKEFFEAYGNGKSARLEDYTVLKGWGGKIPRKLPRGDKGQKECLVEFYQAVKEKKYPMKGADARAGLLATSIALKAVEISRSNVSCDFSLFGSE